MNDVRAKYYDGRSSQPHDVVLRAKQDGTLTVDGVSSEMSYPLSAVKISPRLGNTTRSLGFPDGGKCETLDNDGVDAFVADRGDPPFGRWVHRLESSWRSALAALAIVVVIVIVGFRWGIPVMARHVAMNIPPRLAHDLGSGTLETLDRILFSASQLPEERRAELRKAFGDMARGYSDLPLHLEFRHADLPNAFALPDGTVVVTDELVQLAENDDQILSVLAHEIGHVRHRHTLRMALESSSVGLLATVILGDATQLVALSGALPALYANSRYSRAHETEADSFALEYLDIHGIERHHFADMLALLQRTYGDQASDGALEYLSSHPPTAERAARFKRQSPDPP